MGAIESLARHTRVHSREIILIPNPNLFKHLGLSIDNCYVRVNSHTNMYIETGAYVAIDNSEISDKRFPMKVPGYIYIARPVFKSRSTQHLIRIC